MVKVGFIGCGNMGEAMLGGIINSNFISSTNIYVHTKSSESMNKIKDKYNVTIVQSNIDVAKNVDVIILAIKPKNYNDILLEIKDVITKNQIVVGITPAYSIDSIISIIGDDKKIVRAMPNTPSLVNSGVTGLCFSSNINESEKELIMKIFNTFGKSYIVEETHMAAVGSVSGSSPAFLFMVLEALTEGAIELGMSRSEAYKFACLTMEGASKLALNSTKHPANLRDDVCSPKGTTIVGVNHLEAKGFKGILIEAMKKSAEKFCQMEEEVKEKISKR